MKNNIDLILFLNVYNLVCEKGEKQNDLYLYEGLKAWQDFDGYTCYLGTNQVTMTFLFHGKYNVEYQKEEDFAEFEKLVKSINHTHKSSEV